MIYEDELSGFTSKDLRGIVEKLGIKITYDIKHIIELDFNKLELMMASKMTKRIDEEAMGLLVLDEQKVFSNRDIFKHFDGLTEGGWTCLTPNGAKAGAVWLSDEVWTEPLAAVQLEEGDIVVVFRKNKK